MNKTMVLKDTPFEKVKREALEQAKENHLRTYERRLTQDMIHVKTGIPLSNINRYFNDAEYNPGPENLALICNAMENWLMIDWICAQAGGAFYQRTAGDKGHRAELTASVDKIQRGASALLSGLFEALKDGNLSVDEIRSLIEPFRNIVKLAEDGLHTAEQAGKK
jgi:hypothetical protein